MENTVRVKRKKDGSLNKREKRFKIQEQINSKRENILIEFLKIW